jgi:hypothetical protein
LTTRLRKGKVKKRQKGRGKGKGEALISQDRGPKDTRQSKREMLSLPEESQAGKEFFFFLR